MKKLNGPTVTSWRRSSSEWCTGIGAATPRVPIPPHQPPEPHESSTTKSQHCCRAKPRSQEKQSTTDTKAPPTTHGAGGSYPLSHPIQGVVKVTGTNSNPLLLM